MQWHVDTIPWQEIGSDGTKYALLDGARDGSSVSFSYAFAIPAGFWDPSHWHTQTAHVFVMKGTLYLGYGNQMDQRQATAYPAGSYVIVPANAVHFDGSDEDTIIRGVVNGAWRTHYVDSQHVPSAGTPE